jgi:hypothetical protein
MLRRVALVRTDVSEELIASITNAERISELGTLMIEDEEEEEEGYLHSEVRTSYLHITIVELLQG